MSDSYRDKIYDIAVNTFEVTCYMFPLEEWEIEENDVHRYPLNGIRSVVGFSGAVEGQMVVRPSHDLLSAMAANMLGVEDPDEQQKSSALCEIANIICGNTVPLFTEKEEICYIRPPKILKGKEGTDHIRGTNDLSLKVLLDQGVVEIEFSYSTKEE